MQAQNGCYFASTKLVIALICRSKSKCTKLVYVPSAENRKTDSVPGSIDENLTVLRTSLPKQNLVLPFKTNLEKDFGQQYPCPIF
jgi:hypothetical protein